MNAELIIRELMRLKKFTSKRQLADFLGESPQNIDSWRKRDSVNIKKILKAFPEINANWLITGEGEILRRPTSFGGNAQGDGAMNHSNSEVVIDKFLDEIAQQRRLTQAVIEQNTHLLTLLESVNNSLHACKDKPDKEE
ncbi:MAG: helix-turn-helix domain-containing protein [Paludibacteraceae bacterium]|nr:helix-turn-helix domain-containing protein [Paludibacteraceae bacterium]